MNPPAALVRNLTVALVGNPNCGKTTLFNALTGLNQKVGNYPGVTVERRSGRCEFGDVGLEIVDLPGTYSFTNRSPDERVVVDVVLGRMAGEKGPDVIVNVCDATNLNRNLFLTSQCLEFGLPVVVAATMMDEAEDEGRAPDLAIVAKRLGVPVLRLEAHHGKGVDELKQAIATAAGGPPAAKVVDFPPPVEAGCLRVAKASTPERPFGYALRALLGDAPDAGDVAGFENSALVTSERRAIAAAGLQWWKVEAEARYRFIDQYFPAAPKSAATGARRWSERLDSVLLQRFFGPVIFVLVMALIFQAIFTWAEAPMGWIESAVGALGDWAGALIGPGVLRNLVVDGAIAGVGNVLVFLPQIVLLFLALGLLEDSGYLARGAVIVDRLMGPAGMHGKSFVPLLSSFACAIPGIMATRAIESRSARLVTILVAPLMSCSARLPVYTLIVGAFFGKTMIGGWLSAASLVMLGLYLMSIVAGVTVAWVLRRTVVRGDAPTLLLELPPYRTPSIRSVIRNVFDRAKAFVVRAGTVILALSILLWFLQSYPENRGAERRYLAERAILEAQVAGLAEDSPDRSAAETQLAEIARIRAADALDYSFAGRLGRFIEPTIKPLGFDWRIGIGLIASFAAREVLVSTLAIVFNVSEEEETTLQDALARATDSETGKLSYRPLTGLSLLVFFVLACQCISTLAVIRRETASWRWPLFALGYMTVLAWVASFLVFQIGTLLGF